MKPLAKNLVACLFLCLSRLAVGAAPAGWVVGWGENVSGQTSGVPYSGQSTGVVMIAGQVLTNAIAVAAGMNHSLAIRSDGTVVGWGNNGGGQATGVATAYPGRAAASVNIGGRPLVNAASIEAGWGRSFAINSNGAVVGWGTKFDGSKIQISPGLSNVVSIAAEVGLAVRNDGTVVRILNNQTVEGLSNVVAIAAPFVGNGGGGGMVLLKKDGTIIGGVIGVGVGGEVRGVETIHQIQGISNATAIAVGGQEGFALKSDGTIEAWYQPDKIPAGLSNVVAIAAGTYHGLALTRDGTVVGWDQWQPSYLAAAKVPEGLSNVVAIAAGNNFSLAITTNRDVAERFMKKER